jgi:hypothetical protein
MRKRRNEIAAMVSATVSTAAMVTSSSRTRWSRSGNGRLSPMSFRGTHAMISYAPTFLMMPNISAVRSIEIHSQEPRGTEMKRYVAVTSMMKYLREQSERKKRVNAVQPLLCASVESPVATG